jgi:hypothetical protein
VALLDDPRQAGMLVLALVALAAGAVVALRLHTWLDRRARRRRSAIAQRGERSARAWLEANGFTVREEQSTLHARMLVDGVISEFELCADYVVERNGRTGIVEVKTGAASHPTARSTRRQIFEYAALFDTDVYVFDAERQRIHSVVFESIGRRRPLGSALRAWQSGFVIGVAVTILIAVILWQLRR